MPQVILAESVPLFRCGVRATLEQAGGWTVLEAANQAEILELAQRHQPDCAILDSGSCGYDALETCWMLRQQVPSIGLLILAHAPHEEQLFQFIRHGTNAYEPRSIAPEMLLDRVQRVSCREYLLGNDFLVARPSTRIAPGQAIHPLTKAAAPGAEDDPEPSPLSAREMQILQQIAYGNSNKQIGAVLKISDQTVKNHITSTLRKLSVNDRTAAVMHAISRHWISMDPQ